MARGPLAEVRDILCNQRIGMTIHRDLKDHIVITVSRYRPGEEPDPYLLGIGCHGIQDCRYIIDRCTQGLKMVLTCHHRLVLEE